MASKLFSWFEDFFDKTFDDKNVNATIQKLKKRQADYDAIVDAQMNTTNRLIELEEELETSRRSGNTKLSVTLKKEQEELKENLKNFNEEFEEFFKDLSKNSKFNVDQLKKLMKEGTENEEKTRQTIQKFSKNTTDTFEKVFEGLGYTSKKAASYLTDFASILEESLQQIIETNELLVNQLVRSGSALRSSNFGFDNNGNSLIGGRSLTSSAAINSISAENMIQALQAFSGGNQVGNPDFNKHKEDMQEFAIQQGKLIGLYGVGADSIEKITKTSTQLYGTSIKDLNKTFETSTEKVRAAGLSLKEYYNNLADLSGRTGQRYFSGGANALPQLAQTITKLGTTSDTIFSFFDNYKNINDIYAQSAKNASLGFTNISKISGQLFSTRFTGEYDKGTKLVLENFLKDIQQKYRDGDGNVSAQGIRALQAAGLTEQQIELLQKLNRQTQDYNLTVGQIMGQEKVNFSQRVQLNKLQKDEVGFQGQLKALWGQIKAVFVDPLANVLGPAFTLSLDLLTDAFKVLGFVLEPINAVFGKIGDVLRGIDSAINAVVDSFGEITKSIGLSDNSLKAIKGTFKVVGSILVFSFIQKKGIIQKLLNAVVVVIDKIKAAGNSLSSSFGGGNFFGGKGSQFAGGSFSKGKAILSKSGGFLGKASGFIRKASPWAMAGGLAADTIGSLLPEENTGGKHIASGIGKALSWGAVGAEIGTIVPGIGNVVGAAVGGVAGLVSEWFDYTKEEDEKEKSSKDNNRFKSPLSVNYDYSQNVKDILKNRVVTNALAQQVGSKEQMIRDIVQPKIIIQNNSVLSTAIKLKK